MKLVELHLHPFQAKSYFKPIRNKLDYSKLLLLVSRQLLLNSNDIIENSPKVKLKIDKSKRLFFYQKHKYFSIAYPFSINFDTYDGRIKDIYTSKDIKVDSSSISSAISILNDDVFINHPSLTDYYIGYDTSAEESIYLGIAILEEVFQFEPSYIRYDYDETHVEGRKHPLNHLDVHYSTYGTFKIGIENKIDSDIFEDLLDLNTDCAFITEPPYPSDN